MRASDVRGASTAPDSRHCPVGGVEEARSPRRRWTVPRAVSAQPPAITVALSLRDHGSAYDASPRGTADNPAPA